MAPVTTPAVLLRAHAYGETSRILRFYTREHGLLSVMARGVRTKSGKGGTTLDTFATGELSAYVRPHRDLHTMKDFACTHVRSLLGGDVLRFAGASAVAELVSSNTEQEANPDVFDALEESLNLLEQAPASSVTTACLSGVWRVVVALGFQPELDVCVRCGAPLGPGDMGRFDLGAGGVLCPECAEGATGPLVGPGARAQLGRLTAGDVSEPITHARKHLALLADFVAFHVATKPLKSLGFLGDLLPADGES